MTIIITKPSGEEITIDGTRLCRSSNPVKCYQWSPDMIGALIDRAQHKGWRVRGLADAFRQRETELREEWRRKH